VHPVHTQDVSNFSEMVENACKLCQQDGLGKPGDSLVVTAGVPFGTPGNTNVLRLARIPS
jgi:pyruvate kinase